MMVLRPQIGNLRQVFRLFKSHPGPRQAGNLRQVFRLFKSHPWPRPRQGHFLVSASAPDET